MRSEVSRLGLSTLHILPAFDVTTEMLEADGIHLKSGYGDKFLAHLCQSLRDCLVLPITVPASTSTAPSFIPLVDFADEDSNDDDDEDEVQSIPGEEDRLDTILKIVKSNSRRLSSVKPLRDALIKLDERSSSFEAQVRLRRQRDNLVFARIKEDSDCELNRSREDRVVISGLARASSGASSHKDKKEHYLKIVTDLVSKALPDVDPRPTVSDIIVSIHRTQATPTVEVKFDTSSGAFAFRKSAYQLAKSGDPDFSSLFFSNSVTQATRVRIEIMKALAKKLVTETETAYVHGFSSRPVLYYNAVPDAASHASGTGRSYSFVDSVIRFGDLVQDQDLVAAYKRAGNTFGGAMEQYFVLLREPSDVPVVSEANRVPISSRGASRGARGTPFRGAGRWTRGTRGSRGQKRLGGTPPSTPSKKKTNA